MSAYKDSLGGRWRWRTRVKNPFTGEEGRLSGSSHSALNTRQAAEQDQRAKVQAFMMDPALKPRPRPAQPTLSEFIETIYRPWLVSSQKAGSTIETRESHMVIHILPAFGERRLDELTKFVIEQWVTDLLGSEDLSVRTVIGISSTLHSILTRAAATDRLAAVPVFPEMPKVPTKAPVFLEYEEEKRFHDAAATPMERALLVVATRLGLRAGEQKAMEWSDVSFDRRTLHVSKNFVRGEIKAPKGRADRTLDLDEESFVALKAIRASEPIGPRLVFPTPGGGYMSYRDLERVHKKALVKAGVDKHIRWHDLRHTFGSHLAIAGVPLIVIRDLMGHQSIQTTEIYAHLNRDSGRSALVDVAAARLAQR